ncbi:butyrophilin-like protein 2 isoform X1 [Stegastes partitus]|uniref:Butyrophilin-like protein 2 isoform X1 n=1 Tax=Stegastes partitus TaxID=144197 RepID=A0A9Y4MWZ1_9TELE|nr:PREDICTED: butyrophilin-like protein 2 isoform X1 [Stegastes partitus]
MHPTMNFTFIAAVSLCSLCWISVLGSESQTKEVKPGEDVTLRCSNISKSECVTFWFRLDNRATVDCISVMIRSSGKPTYYDGFKGGKFEMSSNISTISLKIKQVDSSDSGQYFCGFYESPRLLFSVTHLKVAGGDEPHCDTEQNSDGVAKLMCFILAGFTVLLFLVIVGLIVQNRKLHSANKDEPNPAQSENLGSDDQNYATVTFRPKVRRREQETNVIYAATR